MINETIKTKEVWKPILGYEGKYEISSFGRIKSFLSHHGKSERILKPRKTSGGYLFVTLQKGHSIEEPFRVNRLVAQTFIPNPNNYPIVNHKDENIFNNHVDNLEWCTYAYNNSYGTRGQRAGPKISKALLNHPKMSMPVLQYTLDGTFVKRYPSAMEVGRKTGYAQGSISRCCNGQLKQCYGYKWKYEEPQKSRGDWRSKVNDD